MHYPHPFVSRAMDSIGNGRPLPHRSVPLSQLHAAGPADCGPSPGWAGHGGCDVTCDDFFGIDTGTTALNTTATITVNPQRRGRPYRLVVADQIENLWTLDNFRIGADNLLAIVGVTSWASFKSDAGATSCIRGLIVTPGTNVVLVTTNVTQANQRLICNVYMRPIDEPR